VVARVLHLVDAAAAGDDVRELREGTIEGGVLEALAGVAPEPSLGG
jgi:hypothetical protein